MSEFTQLMVSGVFTGMLYALLALGFVVVVKGSGVINFSQGEVVVLGAFVVSWLLTDVGVPFWLGVPATVVVMMVVGAGIERFALRPLQNESMLALVMATIALGSIIRGLVPMIWGDGLRSIPSLIDQRRYEWFGISIPTITFWSAVMVLILLVAFGFFFSRSRLGLAMQAVSDDRVAAQSLGINIRLVNAVSWAMAGGIAALAGYVWGSLLGVDSRLVVLGALIFPVVILGGLESILGAVIGGIVVGLVESFSAGYLNDDLGAGFSTVAPLIMLLLVLFVRPYGLFGRPEIERV
ncbi:branched-chain amino acid ABC transporter permease [Mycobacterium cookii]|jgi:branched-chain amino acid transport system permease protein|uniref:Branched-chain amino acid ABC transporter permease n=1 Tax=Nocardioides furvisabuli TaxID=375542 RepID=A0ABP5IDS1_9ACTN|nr:branched-chain amino acid ABC transporter permease [Nocardioides furvisabuli]